MRDVLTRRDHCTVRRPTFQRIAPEEMPPGRKRKSKPDLSHKRGRQAGTEQGAEVPEIVGTGTDSVTGCVALESFAGIRHLLSF